MHTPLRGGRQKFDHPTIRPSLLPLLWKCGHDQDMERMDPAPPVEGVKPPYLTISRIEWYGGLSLSILLGVLKMNFPFKLLLVGILAVMLVDLIMRSHWTMKLKLPIKIFLTLVALFVIATIFGPSLSAQYNSDFEARAAMPTPPFAGPSVSGNGVGTSAVSGGCANVGGTQNSIDCRRIIKNHYTYITKTYVDYIKSKDGLLEPADDLSPPLPCSIPEDSLAVVAGSNLAATTGDAIVLLQIHGIPIISVRRLNENITIDQLIIFDASGYEILHISNDGYLAARGYDISRPDKSTLVIREENKDLFYIRYINKKTIEIRGEFSMLNSPNVVIDHEYIRAGGLEMRDSCMINGRVGISIQ